MLVYTGEGVGVCQLDSTGNRRTLRGRGRGGRGGAHKQQGAHNGKGSVCPAFSSATCRSGGVLKDGRNGSFMSQDRGELVTLNVHSHGVVDNTCSPPEG